jgi:hypothetical protein
VPPYQFERAERNGNNGSKSGTDCLAGRALCRRSASARLAAGHFSGRAFGNFLIADDLGEKLDLSVLAKRLLGE